MFMKNSIAGISGFLDLAMVPFRSAAVIRDIRLWRTRRQGKVMLLRNAGGADADEELVFQGDPPDCPQHAAALIARGERVIAEGIPLETITVLCARHGYRWRLHADRKPRLRFILEPPQVPSATSPSHG